MRSAVACDEPEPSGRCCDACGREAKSPAESKRTIPVGGRTLLVVEVQDDDADQAPVLVVEDMLGAAASDAA
jgi:hypothetical protein